MMLACRTLGSYLISEVRSVVHSPLIILFLFTSYSSSLTRRWILFGMQFSIWAMEYLRGKIIPMASINFDRGISKLKSLITSITFLLYRFMQLKYSEQSFPNSNSFYDKFFLKLLSMLEETSDAISSIMKKEWLTSLCRFPQQVKYSSSSFSFQPKSFKPLYVKYSNAA